MTEKNNNILDNNEYVAEKLGTGEKEAAISLDLNKEGQINYSFNSLDSHGLSEITDMLAALIVSESRKNPTFANLFIDSLSKLDGSEGLKSADILLADTEINPGDLAAAQRFLSNMNTIIDNKLGATASAIMFSNYDPEAAKNHPESTIPFLYTFSGSPALMANGVNGFINNLTGKAYANGVQDAIDPNVYGEPIREFTERLDYLQSDDEDDKAVNSKENDKGKTEYKVVGNNTDDKNDNDEK